MSFLTCNKRTHLAAPQPETWLCWGKSARRYSHGATAKGAAQPAQLLSWHSSSGWADTHTYIQTDRQTDGQTIEASSLVKVAHSVTQPLPVGKELLSSCLHRTHCHLGHDTNCHLGRYPNRGSTANIYAPPAAPVVCAPTLEQADDVWGAVKVAGHVILPRYEAYGVGQSYIWGAVEVAACPGLLGHCVGIAWALHGLPYILLGTTTGPGRLVGNDIWSGQPLRNNFWSAVFMVISAYHAQGSRNHCTDLLVRLSIVLGSTHGLLHHFCVLLHRAAYAHRAAVASLLPYAAQNRDACEGSAAQELLPERGGCFAQRG
eukprot:213437-Pelagomonas_calceolata.AAC.4